MTIYVDLVFFINFIMDFYILSSVKFLLKRRNKLFRIILGSLFGGCSIFLLFLIINNIVLNIIKIIISIGMIIISFGIKKIKDNIIYMYVISIVLGGSIYLINDSLGYDVDGLLFINNGYSINLIILLLISPIIIFFYIKDFLMVKKIISTSYSINIIFKNKVLKLIGFLDTGNKLIDPYKHRPIILVSRELINIKNEMVLLVPFKSLNNNGLLKCIKCEYIELNNKKVFNVLIGVSELELGIDCILNERLFDI